MQPVTHPAAAYVLAPSAALLGRLDFLVSKGKASRWRIDVAALDGETAVLCEANDTWNKHLFTFSRRTSAGESVTVGAPIGEHDFALLAGEAAAKAAVLRYEICDGLATWTVEVVLGASGEAVGAMAMCGPVETPVVSALAGSLVARAAPADMPLTGGPDAEAPARCQRLADRRA